MTVRIGVVADRAQAHAPSMTERGRGVILDAGSMPGLCAELGQTRQAARGVDGAGIEVSAGMAVRRRGRAPPPRKRQSSP